MSIELTPRQMRAARLRSNGLAGQPPADVPEAVQSVVGVQAQDARAARLAVRARTSGATSSAVDAAIAGRQVVCTWAMRGTLHWLAAEDVRWIVALLGPRFAAKTAGRRRQLGLDDATSARGIDAVQGLLSVSGPLTRAEIVSGLAERGVWLDPKSQAPAHLVSYAAMLGLVCRGQAAPRGEPTYLLIDDWVDQHPPARDAEALARLAERYLAGFGPAAPEDFAGWSGLPIGRARQGFAALDGKLTSVSTSGERAYVLSTHDPGTPEATGVRLLGHFDTYLLGYRSRSLTVPARFDRRIQSGGGFIMPAVLVDGVAVGNWRLQQSKEIVDVLVEPFADLPPSAEPGLRDEVADIGRFLGVEAELRISSR